MKKKGRSIIRKALPTVLYLDDIKYIVELLEKEANEISVKVRDRYDEYEFNSSSEINSLRDLPNIKFNNLTIESFRLGIIISMYEYNGSIYIFEDTPLLRGLMEKIQERLKLRRRKYFWLTTNPILPTITFIYGLYMFSRISHYIPLVVLVFSAIWGILGGYYLRYKSYTILFNNYRNEMPSFIKRNKDSIVLAIFSALVGAGLTYLVKKLY